MARVMKDSGIEWIGAIPESWNLYPARYAFSEIRKKNTEGAITNALKFFNGTIIPKANFDADSDDYVAETITTYTIVEPDTIMINGLNLNYDLKSLRVGLVKEKGVITSAYLALWPDNSRILPKFATYLFKGYETKMAFHNMGAGIRKTLGFKEFKRQPVLFPTMEEQQCIVSFLDSECSHIDSVIEQTRASIEEYEKLKQAVITQAVTKGIRPNREMKDSGISVVTQLPLEWDIFPIKRLCSIPLTDGTHMTPEYSDAENGSPFLSSKDISSGYIDWSGIKYITKELHEELQRSVSPQVDDILLAKNGTTGVAAIVEEDIVFDVYVTIAVIRANRNLVLPKYLLYSINSNLCKRQFDEHLKGIGVPNLHLGTINNTKVFVPDIDEQIEIIHYLDEMVPQVDAVVKKKQLLLDSLELYKKSLIYEYVTGKKEVPA